MPALRIAKQAGRRAFGLDPANYHNSRPDYPEWVYQMLRSQCGLGHGAVTLEVGAGQAQQPADCSISALIP
jgi:hypothetical protein